MKARAEAERRPQGPDRPRGQAGPGRHPRHRVRRAAPPARARPRSTPSCGRRPRSTRSAELAAAGYVDADDAARARRRLPLPAHGRAPAPARRRAAGPRPARPTRDARDRLARVMGYRDTAEADALRAARRRPAPPPGHACGRSTSGSTSGPCSRRSPGRRAPALHAPRPPTPGWPPSASPTPTRTRQAVARADPGPHPLVAAHAAAAAAAARLAVRVARPRPRAARPAQPGSRAAARRPSSPRAFRDSPEAARRLCVLLGTSRLLGDDARAQPRPRRRASADPDAAAHPAARRSWSRRRRPPLAWRADAGRAPARACAGGRTATCCGIAARDVLGDGRRRPTVGARPHRAGRGHASRPRSTRSSRRVPFAVIAMGRFGGAELSYASDLDVLFVYDGDDAGRLRRGRAARPTALLRVRRRRDAGRRASTRSTPTCGPRASRARWPAASTATPTTSSAGPRCGSARPWSGPAPSPATPDTDGVGA